MKRAEMRIVGLNPNRIYIQRKNKEWEQTDISFEEFRQLMENEFPEYLKEYEGEDGYKMAEFFYRYGEDGKETYIFK